MLRIKSIPCWNFVGVLITLFPMVNILYTILNVKMIISIFNMPDAIVERLAKSWKVVNNQTIANTAKMIPNIITRIRFIPSALMFEISVKDDTKLFWSLINNFIPKNSPHPTKIISNNIIINTYIGLFENPPGKYTMPAITTIIKIINTAILYRTNLSLLNMLLLGKGVPLSDIWSENIKNKHPKTIMAIATENVWPKYWVMYPPGFIV